MKDVNIGTYNCLFPASASDLAPHTRKYIPQQAYILDKAGNKVSNWKSRKEIIFNNIVNSKLNILCLQECTREWVEDYSHKLSKSGYRIEWTPHVKTCMNPWGHGTAIVYQTARFKLKRYQTIPFEDPKILNSHGKGKIRSTLIVDLQDTDQKVIRIASAHLQDMRSENDIPDRRRHIYQIRQIVDKTNEYPIALRVIAGDFNQDQFGDRKNEEFLKTTTKIASSVIIKELEENGYRHDKNFEPTNVEKQSRRHIDWIFSKGKDVKLQKTILSNFDPKGSDHKMIATRIFSPKRDSGCCPIV